MMFQKLRSTKSMKYRLWLYFVLFTAVFTTVIWLLQVFFLGNFYEPIKIGEISDIGKSLTDIANKDGQVQITSENNFVIGDELKNSINEQVYKNGLSAMLIGYDNLNNIAGYVHRYEGGSLDSPETQLNLNDFLDFQYQLEKTQSSSVCYVRENMRFSSKSIIYGTELASNTFVRLYLYISAPLAPVQTAVGVIQNQLIYVVIIVLLLSFLLAYFVSKKLTKPIEDISAAASKLADGNYEVQFTGSGYKEIEELSDTLNYATGELQKSDQLKRDIVANVSHDLKTPLTMIRAYAEMIHDISGNNPEKRTAHTEIIMDESDRLTRLVNDILDLSKLQSGASELKLKEFDLASMSSAILSRFRFLQEKDGYHIETQFDEKVPVLADEQKLEQVIYNLVGNAMNYTGDDKRISVRVFKENGAACFSVTDTGKGIEQEEIDTIWDRYYKSSKTHKRGVVGTGLGLSIVKNILILHNAQYGVDSTPGEGSTFWFKLPLAEE